MCGLVLRDDFLFRATIFVFVCKIYIFPSAIAVAPDSLCRTLHFVFIFDCKIPPFRLRNRMTAGLFLFSNFFYVFPFLLCLMHGIAQQRGERSRKRRIIALSCCAFEEHVAHRYGATGARVCVGLRGRSMKRKHCA